MSRGGQLNYPDNKRFNYLSAYFFYYSKQLFENSDLRGEEDRKTLISRFDEVYNTINTEVNK